ncbi:MAG: flippase [Ignavibacteriales bacterium]|nr:flippase [Ignavibacteriales bacterium]
MATQTKKITLDTAAIFFGKVVGLIFGMMRLSYLAANLGVANFGILNFALYFCSLFQVLFDFGMSQLLTREIARDLSKSTGLVGRIIYLKIIVVLIAGLVVGLAGIVLHFDNQTNWAVLLTTVVFAINGISMIFLSAFQAHRKMTIVSVSNILNDLLLSVFVVLLIKASPYVITVLILSIIVALANMIFLYFKYSSTIGIPEYSIDKKIWRSFLNDSTPIAMNSLGASMYMFIGPTVLKYTRGDIEVGIYTAGYKLISILMMIPTAYSQVVYPIFSEFYTTAANKLSKALNDSLRIMLIIAFPVATGIIILAPKLFAIIFTTEFNPGIIVLQLGIISIIISYLNWVTATFLMAINRQTLLMFLSIIIGLATTAFSVVIVPKYGYIVLPLTMIGVEFLIFIVHRLYLQKISYGNLSIISIIKPFVAALLMGTLLVLLSGLNFFLIVLLGAVSYLIVLYFIGGFGEQEMELAAKLFRIPLQNKSVDSR